MFHNQADVFDEPISDTRGTVKRTADGVTITPGMAVWNYDLQLDWVSEALDYAGEWYTMRRGSIADGEKLLTRHPLTGERADDAAVNG